MAFAVLIAMLVGIGESELRSIKEIDKSLSDINSRSDKLQLARKALRLSNSNSQIMMEIFLTQHRVLVDPLLTARSENSKRISQLLADIARRCESEGEKQRLSEVVAARAFYTDSYMQALHLLVDEGKRDAATAVMVNETLPALLKYHAAWDEFVDFQNNQRDVATQKTEVYYSEGRHVASLLIVLVIAVAFAIALVSTRGMAREITFRIEAEQKVSKLNSRLEERNQQLELRNREVERATQTKDNFLASMSHELRTPLNAILGFSDLLAEGTSGALNTKQKRFVNHIKQGSAHLLQLINEILDLSKIEAGQLELHTEEFLVQDVLPEVLSTIEPLAGAKNIRLEQKLESKLLVKADRVRFKQILYNLLSNAVKFTPNDGRIYVESVDDWDFIRVSVTDTGIGISPEDQKVVFEEFRQAEGTDRTQQGTGLGLAISKWLVEQQGGRISLESELGKGSRFTFFLNAVEPARKVESVRGL
jgi:signal transduction histidine kinase